MHLESKLSKPLEDPILGLTRSACEWCLQSSAALFDGDDGTTIEPSTSSRRSMAILSDFAAATQTRHDALILRGFLFRTRRDVIRRLRERRVPYT
jgi:hypothetical protein